MEIRTPRGAVIYKDGMVEAKIEWAPGFENDLNRQYGAGGTMQREFDYAVLNGCRPYLPFKTGTLMRSGELGTVIGSGELVWIAPYARFLYYGLVMRELIVDKETGETRLGSTWASPGGKKVTTPVRLVYQGGGKRGSFWFERWKNDNLSSFLSNFGKKYGVKVEMH